MRSHMERLYRRWRGYLVLAVVGAVVGVAELTVKHYRESAAWLVGSALVAGWALLHLRPRAR